MGGAKAKERRRRGKRNGSGGGGGGRAADASSAAPAARPSAEDREPPSADAPAAGPHRPHSAPLVRLTEEAPTWYDCGRNTAGRDDVDDDDGAGEGKGGGGPHARRRGAREAASAYRRRADEIYGREVSLARNGGMGGATGGDDADERWVETTMRRGTLKDRIAAASVVVTQDPVHKLHALDLLLDLAGCGVGADGAGGSVPNSRVGQMASEALADLFANTLLPPDRKLVSLDERPLRRYEGGRTLSPRVLLLWRYEEMVKLRYASYLSRYLGRTLAGEDETSKRSALAAAAGLLTQRPEGEEVLLAMIVNKIGDPARKIAGAAGHQLRLILEEHPVMINVVAREVQQLAHRPHLSPRALYNCVVFLNQLQLSRDEEESGGAETATDGKRFGKTTSLPASLINTYFHLFEMTVKKDERAKKGSKQSAFKDSAASKSRLLSALLTGVNRAHPYLPKKDAAMEQHVDALYRISHTAPPAAATQALMLLFQLAVGSGDAPAAGDGERVAAARKDRFYRALYSKLADGDMFAGRQLTLFFNLLYKAMKHDARGERVRAFAKRLLHAALHQPSAVVCGSLFLLSEIARCRPKLRTAAVGSDGSEDASFDPTKREPGAAFSGGGGGLFQHLWELSLLAHHFHPSVATFAAGSDGAISYKGDPLKDFSLTPFLDKFAFRNPKSLDKLSKRLRRGESIAERKSGLSGGPVLPLNDPSYLLDAKSVPEEEKFFHQFFVERARRDEIKGIVRGSGANKDKDDSDLEDEALNAAEADEMVGDFEGDTDSEEEAFVTGLAEKLMESAGNGKANLDEEDPDMDGWSDFDDDDEEEGEKSEDEDQDESANFGKGNSEDAFMDAASSDDEEGESALGAEEDNNDGFGVEADLPFELLGGDGSDDDSESPTSTRDDKPRGKRKKPASMFADADEYEKILEEEAKGKDQPAGSAMEKTSRKKKRRNKKKS